MARLAVLAGTGYSGEDILYKLPWIEALEEPVAVASRIDPDVHFDGVLGLPVRGVPLERLRDAFERLREVAPFDVAYRDPAYTAPLDDDEVDRLEAWLGTSFGFLASMNRMFQGPDGDRRREERVREAMARCVRFFRAFFERHGTEWLATTLEDDLYCVVADAVARRMGVKVLGTLVSRFPRRGLVFTEDFGTLLPWNDDATPLDEVLAMYDPATIAGDALQRTQGYWDLRALPQRVRDAAFARPYRSFYRHAVAHYPDEALVIPPLDLVGRAVDHARRVARRALARRRTHDVPDGPYVLFPLHYTEDAQITFREPHLDQVALVQAAARSLPVGHVLAVKPHPHYFGSDQPRRDLARIAKTPGVVLLHAHTPPLPVLKRAAAVLTVNSTTGIEALAHGVPVVTTGHDWYCHQPPCRVVRDLRDLPAALLQAVTDGPPGHPEAGHGFVRRAHAHTVWIEGESFGHGFYGFTAGDGRRVADALQAALARAGPAVAPKA